MDEYVNHLLLMFTTHIEVKHKILTEIETEMSDKQAFPGKIESLSVCNSVKGCDFGSALDSHYMCRDFIFMNKVGHIPDKRARV